MSAQAPFPHGTPEGYKQGCRGIACANHGSEELMTCEQAQVRFAGDFAYRRAVLAGTATAEREVFAGEGRASGRKPGSGGLVHPVEVPVLPTSTFDVAAVRGEQDEKGEAVKIPHGTENGYKKGCRKKDAEKCPAKLAGGRSCFEVNAEIQRGYAARRKAREAAAAAAVAPKPVPVAIPAPVPVYIPEEAWQDIEVVYERSDPAQKAALDAHMASGEAVVDVSPPWVRYERENGELTAENAALKERVALLELELDVAKSQVRTSGKVDVGGIRLPAQVSVPVPGWGLLEVRLGWPQQEAS